MDFPVTEYDDATSSLRALETHLLSHAKHYNVYTGCIEDFMQWMEIAEILAQGGDVAKSKLMTVAVAIVSPLALPDFNAANFIDACFALMDISFMLINSLTLILLCPSHSW
jgi:hypothetical protein